MEITKELVEKAKACQTADERIALAKENDIELSLEERKLADEELCNVAGGVESLKIGDRPVYL